MRDDDKSLPDTGGGAGGASPSDLKRGYSDCTEKYEQEQYPMYDEPRGGFLNRPQGWER